MSPFQILVRTLFFTQWNRHPDRKPTKRSMVIVGQAEWYDIKILGNLVFPFISSTLNSGFCFHFEMSLCQVTLKSDNTKRTPSKQSFWPSLSHCKVASQTGSDITNFTNYSRAKWVHKAKATIERDSVCLSVCAWDIDVKVWQCPTHTILRVHSSSFTLQQGTL